MDSSLKGQVVIVTGSSSGIGLSTSTMFLKAGAKVLGVDMAPEPESLAGMSGFKFLQANLIESSAPSLVVQTCIETFGGRIDALMNVAGVMDTFNSVDTLEDADWDRVIAINLTAPVRLMREVVKVMQKQKSGSIVNVSSKAGISGASSGVAYTASKHGLVGATKNVAWRFKDDGIRCNAVCPGAVGTGIANSIDMSKCDMEALKTFKPVHALHNPVEGTVSITPDMIAGTMLFLCTDFAKVTNGAIIPLDNAWSTT